MFTRILQMLLFLILPGLPDISAAQEHSLKTFEDVSDFMQTYYQQPRPDLIASLIGVLHSSGFVQNDTNAPPNATGTATESAIIGFFSEVFAANPERLSQWQALIAKQDEQTKAALARSLSVSKAGGVLNLDGHSAALNDEYWSAFFATGNPKFIDRLVDQLRYFDERNDEDLFFVGGTAKWSLASNAQTQPEVRLDLEKAKPKADKRTQELITQLLNEDQARIKQEISDIIRTQREAGKWNKIYH